MQEYEYFQIDNSSIDKNDINSCYGMRPFFKDGLPIYLSSYDAFSHIENSVRLDNLSNTLVLANRLFFCYSPLLGDFFHSTSFPAKDLEDNNILINGKHFLLDFTNGFIQGRAKFKEIYGEKITTHQGIIQQMDKLKLDFRKWYRQAIDDSQLLYVKKTFLSIFFLV